MNVKKCHKLNPIPSFVINEHLGFLKFIKAKKSFEMEYPYYDVPSFPIRTTKDKLVYLSCDSLNTITFLFYLKKTHFPYTQKKELKRKKDYS